MTTKRRGHMEKQLHLFYPDTEGDEYLRICQHLPEQNRQEIETMFVQILIKHLYSFFEEEEHKEEEHHEP
jgi:hypothetical protein